MTDETPGTPARSTRWLLVLAIGIALIAVAGVVLTRAPEERCLDCKTPRSEHEELRHVFVDAEQAKQLEARRQQEEEAKRRLLLEREQR